MDAAGLAITVTGCVLKLVAFSTDFVTNVKQVYHQGATDRNTDLGIVANSIRDATKALETQLDEFSNQDQEGSTDPVQRDIRALATRAAAIGNELASLLKRVHADPRSKRKALKAAIRGMWDAEEIERVEKQLDGIRNEIQLRILIDIRQMIRGSHSDEYQRMVLTLERTSNNLTEAKEDSRNTVELLNQIHSSIKNIQQSINTTPVSGEPNPGLTTKVSYKPDIGYQIEAEKSILRWLWYPSIHDREESIEKAHYRTLNWIYEDPKADDQSRTWDNFANFLTSETSMYWITGKPGSGKSTLIKFISEQLRTEELLQQWAGNRELLSAPFYFFYKGADEQKTELGLLRSLLHLILSRKRELIPVVFNERFIASLDGIGHAKITLPEAKRALRILFRDNPHLCFFLTIDGLDEFDPEVSLTHVTSLIELTETLSNFKNVKIVVSSRQLPEFELGFEACPRLRIHELTKQDIRHYATERLESHRYMNTLLKRDPANSRALIESVISMSAGVFLWVRIVTQSLLQGLTNRDTIRDLQQRLEGLPTDLHDLYKVMLERVDQRYRSQTCELLQLAYYGIMDDSDQLSALGLWFAERADSNMTILAETKPIDHELVDDRIDEIESRLKSRCLGLVEIQNGLKSVYDGSASGGVDENLTQAMVVFLHRTVTDFLRGSFWEEFSKMHSRPEFNPRESLLRSTILLIKTYRSCGRDDWSVISRLIAGMTRRAQALERESKSVSPELLKEFDSAVAIHFAKCSDNLIDARDRAGTMTVHWSKYFFREYGRLYEISMPGLPYKYPPEDTQPSLLSFAIKIGLESYVTGQIKMHGPGIIAKQGVPLLGHALCPSNDEVETSINIVKILLDNGSDPQQTFEGTSVWGWFWYMLFYGSTNCTRCCPRWVLEATETDMFHLMRLMLTAGAEPNIIIPWMYFSNKNIERRWSYCTPLVALARLREFLLYDYIANQDDHILWHEERRRRQDLDELVSEIEKVIGVLKERGGVRKEEMESKEFADVQLFVTAPCGARDYWQNKPIYYLRATEKRRMRKLPITHSGHLRSLDEQEECV
ncbi:hypothetical protein F4776DRAFT_643993 [Hypoxylon sp. NC0597]|nr:hypothetical protein F4776DRAFT_643993 [Hypoxylon sp. NC0597]